MNKRNQELPGAVPFAASRQASFWPALLGVGAAAFLLATFAGCEDGLRDEAMGARNPAVGRRLPGLELQGLTGDSQDLTLNELDGKVVVLNFWATWCPPCRAELPEIAALWFQMRDQSDFRLLAVSCDGQDSDLDPLREKTKAFLTERQFQMPTYGDRSEQTRRAVAMALDENSFAFPTTVVLDRTGVIRGVWIGYEPAVSDQLKELVGKLLAEKS